MRVLASLFIAVCSFGQFGCGSSPVETGRFEPNDSLALHYRQLAREAEDTLMQLALWDTAIKYKPDDIWAMEARIEIFDATGEQDSVLIAVKRMLRVCTNPKDSAVVLGNHILTLARIDPVGDHDEWLSAYLRMTGDSSLVYQHAASVGYGDSTISRQQMERNFIKAIEKAPDQTKEAYLCNLAHFYLWSGDTVLACTTFCGLSDRMQQFLRIQQICRCKEADL